MRDDPDLDELEHRNRDGLDPSYDDDVYDDLPPAFPVAFQRDGAPVPDLDAIPQDQWKDVLRSCTSWARVLALDTTKTHAERVAADWILVQLDGEARMRRSAALQESAPPPAVTLDSDIRPRRSVRQVNFRMSRNEYSELDRVARAYGVSAPRLARMLTIRGVRRALEGA